MSLPNRKIEDLTKMYSIAYPIEFNNITRLTSNRTMLCLPLPIRVPPHYAGTRLNIFYIPNNLISKKKKPKPRLIIGLKGTGFRVHTSCDCPESFLTSCVPDLEFDTFAIKFNCSYLKINTAKESMSEMWGFVV
ncbi:hypothetical protein LXL04_014965 [Taraxacum kok-saghyz]